MLQADLSNESFSRAISDERKRPVLAEETHTTPSNHPTVHPHTMQADAHLIMPSVCFSVERLLRHPLGAANTCIGVETFSSQQITTAIHFIAGESSSTVHTSGLSCPAGGYPRILIKSGFVEHKGQRNEVGSFVSCKQ